MNPPKRIGTGWLRPCLFCLALIISGSSIRGQAAAQKGGNPGGRTPPGPVAAPEPFFPDGTSIYPQEAMSSGRCQVGARGFILALSDDPAFMALVQEDLAPWNPNHERGIADEQSWARRMKSFVPLLLKGLDSENGCIQLEAIRYLEKTGDERAVEPLCRLVQRYPLDCEAAMAALQALAVTYQDKRAVPLLERALAERDYPDPLVDALLDTTQRGLIDVRLLRAVMARMDRSPRSLADLLTFQALSRQAGDGTHKPEVIAFFKRHLRQPEFGAPGTGVARLIASEETFEDIRSFYTIHCPGKTTDCGTLLGILQNIGGPKYYAFARQRVEESRDPVEKARCASDMARYLKSQVPSVIPAGQSVLDWLVAHAGESLNLADWGEVLLLDADAKISASPERRAVFWERAAATLRDNKLTYYWIELQLYNAYGPQGLGDDEKALAAIAEVVDHCGPNFPNGIPQEWVRSRDDLRRKLQSRSLGASARIEGLAPMTVGRDPGSWSGQLIKPESNGPELTETIPFAYLEYVIAPGQTVVLPARLRFQPSSDASSRTVQFEVTPLPGYSTPSVGVSAVRLRLLYLPRKDGFSGAVVSELVPLEESDKRK